MAFLNRCWCILFTDFERPLPTRTHGGYTCWQGSARHSRPARLLQPTATEAATYENCCNTLITYMATVSITKDNGIHATC